MIVNIAQQPPFRLVDSVIDYVGNVIRCKYQVKEDNPLLHDGKLSTEGMIECLAQTAAVKSVIDDPDNLLNIGYLASIKSFSAYSEIEVGQEIILELTLLQKLMQFSIFTGRITHLETLVAEGELRVFDKQS